MEYVENVVKAPKKPTFKINLISSDTSIEDFVLQQMISQLIAHLLD